MTQAQTLIDHQYIEEIYSFCVTVLATKLKRFFKSQVSGYEFLQKQVRTKRLVPCIVADHPCESGKATVVFISLSCLNIYNPLGHFDFSKYVSGNY